MLTIIRLPDRSKTYITNLDGTDRHATFQWELKWMASQRQTESTFTTKFHWLQCANSLKEPTLKAYKDIKVFVDIHRGGNTIGSLEYAHTNAKWWNKWNFYRIRQLISFWQNKIRKQKMSFWTNESFPSTLLWILKKMHFKKMQSANFQITNCLNHWVCSSVVKGPQTVSTVFIDSDSVTFE